MQLLDYFLRVVVHVFKLFFDRVVVDLRLACLRGTVASTLGQMQQFVVNALNAFQVVERAMLLVLIEAFLTYVYAAMDTFFKPAPV